MSSEESSSFLSRIIDNKMIVFYTFLIYFNNFAYGITANIIGGVMVDLTFIYSTTISQISFIQIAFGVGYLIGSMANGLYRYLNRQLCLTFFVFLMAICNAFLPYYGKLWLLITGVILINIGCGAWDAATNIWLVDMWPISNSAILQGSRFTYGLGAIVSPLLTSSYVHGYANVTNDNHTITIDDRIHSLTVPFAINGTLQIIVPIIFLVNFLLCRYEQHDSSKLAPEEDDSATIDLPSEDKDFSSIPNRTWKIALISASASTYIAAELGYFAFVTSMYQKLDIQLAASTATQVQSIMFATYTMGRLLSAFISLKVKPDIILAYHFVIILISVAILFIGKDNLTLIYIGNSALGFGCSAVWPGMFAFTAHFLCLTSRICSLLAFLCGLVSICFPLIMNRFFNDHPMILLYMFTLFIVFSIAFFIAIRVWIMMDKTKPSQNMEEEFRRYSIAGPRLSVHWANYREDHLRRKSISASKYSVETNDRRKSTVSAKLNKNQSIENELRRKSTVPGF